MCVLVTAITNVPLANQVGGGDGSGTYSSLLTSADLEVLFKHFVPIFVIAVAPFLKEKTGE